MFANGGTQKLLAGLLQSIKTVPADNAFVRYIKESCEAMVSDMIDNPDEYDNHCAFNIEVNGKNLLAMMDRDALSKSLVD